MISDCDIFAVSEYGKFGYINNKGEVLLPLQYDLCTRFRDGKAAIVKDDEIAFIDDNFNVIKDFKKAEYWKHIYLLTEVDGLLEAYYYKDETASSWARKYIVLADGIGIVPDELKTKYKNNISRKEFCELLINAIYRNTLNEDMFNAKTQEDLLIDAAKKSNVNPFKDTDSEHVILAYYMGIVKGKGTDLFVPDGEITRQEAAVMLMRAYNICKPQEQMKGYEEEYLNNKFVDAKDVSKWAKEFVYYASKAEIMNGVGNDMFNPRGKYTVEQSITTIIRLYEGI